MQVQLEGVPETLLWTLYQRAGEARRSDSVLRDPRAVEAVDAIDFPFEQRFGKAGSSWSQWQALRARCFDREVERFLRDHPDGTVVALGEGLETQFWRVDNGRVHWLTIDLAEAIEVRRRILPSSARQYALSCSALDTRWIDVINPAPGVLITAQGLFMYLAPDDVRGLVKTCAARLPGGALAFDAVPRWLSERSRQGKLGSPDGWQPPPWTWWMDAHEQRILRETPNVTELRRLRLPRGRGVLLGYVVPGLARLPGLSSGLFSIMRAEFGPEAAIRP